jgi:hypothetical protein
MMTPFPPWCVEGFPLKAPHTPLYIFTLQPFSEQLKWILSGISLLTPTSEICYTYATYPI